MTKKKAPAKETPTTAAPTGADLHIEHWPVDKLKPYERNAKSHPPEQIALLARILAKHGFDQPIVVNKNGTIVKGHGRWLAAREAGLATVPVIVRQLTKAQEAEARIADNRVSEFGWDFDTLVADVLGTLPQGLDIEMTGWSLKDLGLEQSSGGVDMGAELDGAGALPSTEGMGIEVKSQYGVIVMCEDEDKQREVFEQLQADGYNCRVVVV